MKVLRTVVVAAALLSLAVPAAGAQPRVLATATADAPRYDTWRWADAEDATIHPGVQTHVEGGQCTSNFVFVQVTTVSGVPYLTDVLLGFAGHCATTTGAADECGDHALPVGHPVTVQGAQRTASVAYNATLTMQRLGEGRRAVCMNNDFGLVRLHRDDWHRVNPSVPVFGGPVGLNTTGTSVWEDIHSWGNSNLRLGLRRLSPKQGYSLGTSEGGWNHDVMTLTPGIPGDSGSGHLDGRGRALGVTSTIEYGPAPASTNLTDLHRALSYAVSHEPGLADLRLEEGTEPFDPRAVVPIT